MENEELKKEVKQGGLVGWRGGTGGRREGFIPETENSDKAQVGGIEGYVF